MSDLPAALLGAASVVLADGADGADIVPAGLAAEGRLADARVVVGWLPGDRVWTDALDGADALMGGYGVRAAIRAGRATYRPVRLSAVPRFLAALPRPMVTVVRGRSAGDGFVFGASVGWAPAAARLADAVVVEVDPAGPAVPGPTVPGDVAGVVEGTAAVVAPAWGEPDGTDRAIATHVTAVLPPAPTLQYGPARCSTRSSGTSTGRSASSRASPPTRWPRWPPTDACAAPPSPATCGGPPR